MPHVLKFLVLLASMLHAPHLADQGCYAATAYAEARNQGDVGMLAVMRTARNRANDPAHRWPRSVCAVVTQPRQFEGVEHWRMPADKPMERAAWLRALVLARDEGAAPAEMNGECRTATSFDRARKPAHGLQPVCKIGAHTFYVESRAHVARLSTKIAGVYK